jgi:hypothetical protein
MSTITMLRWNAEMPPTPTLPSNAARQRCIGLRIGDHRWTYGQGVLAKPDGRLRR